MDCDVRYYIIYNFEIQAQMLHVWNINLHLGHFWGKCR